MTNSSHFIYISVHLPLILMPHQLNVEGEGGIKLKTFKEKLQLEKIVNFFKSPADLRAHVINSLSKISQPDALQTQHYVSEIPAPS